MTREEFKEKYSRWYELDRHSYLGLNYYDKEKEEKFWEEFNELCRKYKIFGYFEFTNSPEELDGSIPGLKE